MHTAETFRIRHPEFADTDLDQVDACLAAAALEIDADVFGDRTNEVHGLLTAHKLQMGPLGMNARLTLKDGSQSTVYWPQYMQIVMANTAGFRVA